MVMRLVLARVPHPKDIRALLRSCKAMAALRGDEDTQTTWLARNCPERGVLLAAKFKQFSVALRLLKLGLPCDAGMRLP